ncbi:MAG TPA: hypothetical protein VIL74_06905 [Pyrinomonadaceae bacterium]|jgi:hypothetical protein
MMTNEQRNDLRAALKAVHDRVHELYPRGSEDAPADRKSLRNQLLVVDLAVHLADEIVSASAPDIEKIVERTANLLFAARLVAPERGLGEAAERLLEQLSAVDRAG